jgi:hypothetical protein
VWRAKTEVGTGCLGWSRTRKNAQGSVTGTQELKLTTEMGRHARYLGSWRLRYRVRFVMGTEDVVRRVRDGGRGYVM